MKVAGVSVNLKSLPSREVLIEQALKTERYRFKRDALELIEKEIKESGLFKQSTRKPKKSNKSSSKHDNELDNTENTDTNKQS